jgi:hypothetical protein
MTVGGDSSHSNAVKKVELGRIELKRTTFVKKYSIKSYFLTYNKISLS